MQKLIETTGRFVANGSAPGSGVTAPYKTIDVTGRVEPSHETTKRTGADTTKRPTMTSKVPDRKIREMPKKSVPSV